MTRTTNESVVGSRSSAATSVLYTVFHYGTVPDYPYLAFRSTHIHESYMDKHKVKRPLTAKRRKTAGPNCTETLATLFRLTWTRECLGRGILSVTFAESKYTYVLNIYLHLYYVKV